MITYIPHSTGFIHTLQSKCVLTYDLPGHLIGTVDSKTTRVGTGRGLETLEQVEKTAGKNVVL